MRSHAVREFSEVVAFPPGPSGAVAAYAATVFPELKPREVPVIPPVLILCGSFNAMSREQIARLGVPVFTLSDDLQLPSAATGSNQSLITAVASAPSSLKMRV